MDFRAQTFTRLVIVYLVAIPVLSVFIEVAWGITHGVLSGLSLRNNPTFSEEVVRFASERGIDLSAGQRDIRASLKSRLSDEDKAELEKIIRKYHVVTFGSTFFTSVLAFGLVGFLTAILTSSWMLVGLLPLASFAVNNPIRRYAIIADIPFGEQVLLVFLAQFGAIYLFAYLGAELRIRRAKKRLAISGE
jgi:hypothetical protein